jgi:hypothetical protein
MDVAENSRPNTCGHDTSQPGTANKAPKAHVLIPNPGSAAHPESGLRSLPSGVRTFRFATHVQCILHAPRERGTAHPKQTHYPLHKHKAGR